MSSAAVRYKHLQQRTVKVEKFCALYGFELVSLNAGYQLRVEGLADFYPVNGYWHWLADGERGSWNTEADMREIFLRKLPTYRKGDPSKYSNSESPMRPVTKSELGAIYLDKEHEDLPFGVSRVHLSNPQNLIPKEDTYRLSNVRTQSVEQYDKWYRRLWRAARKRLWLTK